MENNKLLEQLIAEFGIKNQQSLGDPACTFSQQI